MKKRLVLSLSYVLSLLVVCGFVLATAQAEETDYEREYDSNGAVGFYGKYVFPTEKPDEETPHPGIVKPEPKPKPGITLPQTGEMATFSLSAGGLLVVTAASIIYVVKKKRVEEEN